MVKLIAFLKRKPGMSREQFARRWVESHAKMAAQLPGLRGYRINIATGPNPNRSTMGQRSCGGIASTRWRRRSRQT